MRCLGNNFFIISIIPIIINAIIAAMVIYAAIFNFLVFFIQLRKLFHDGDPYNLEISRLICSANQWTGFYMIGASVIKELTETSVFFKIQSTKVSN